MRVVPTRKSLAAAYDWHVETLRKKLARIGITHRGVLTPMDLHKIYTEIGSPEQLRRMAEKFAV